MIILYHLYANCQRFILNFFYFLYFFGIFLLVFNITRHFYNIDPDALHRPYGSQLPLCAIAIEALCSVLPYGNVFVLFNLRKYIAVCCQTSNLHFFINIKPRPMGEVAGLPDGEGNCRWGQRLCYLVLGNISQFTVNLARDNVFAI